MAHYIAFSAVTPRGFAAYVSNGYGDQFPESWRHESVLHCVKDQVGIEAELTRFSAKNTLKVEKHKWKWLGLVKTEEGEIDVFCAKVSEEELAESNFIKVDLPTLYAHAKDWSGKHAEGLLEAVQLLCNFHEEATPNEAPFPSY